MSLETIVASLETISNLPNKPGQDDVRVVLTVQPSGEQYLYGGETGKPTEVHGSFTFNEDRSAYISALQDDIDHNLGDWLEDVATYHDLFPFIGYKR